MLRIAPLLPGDNLHAARILDVQDPQRMARFEFAADPRYVRIARAVARRDPLITHLGDGDQANVTLILSELVSNAVEASAPGSTVSVNIAREGPALVISVTNQGQGHLIDGNVAMPAESVVRGRGLALVSMLSRDLTVSEHNGCTTVKASI